MMENPQFLIWAGFGVIGWIIARRYPQKFLFDDPNKLTIYTVLMAFWAPVWGGPLYLLYVLLTPSKQVCPHCKRVSHKDETICPFCDKPLQLSQTELQQILEKNRVKQIENQKVSKEFGNSGLVALLLFFVFAPLLTFAWWKLLEIVGEWRVSMLPDSSHKLMLESTAWLIPAIFLGILTSALPMNYIYKWLYKNKAEQFKALQKQMYPGMSVKFTQYFFAIMSFVIIAVILLFMDWYVVAYPDKLVVNNFLGIGETEHNYIEIVSIRSSLQLKEAKWDHPIYVIEFVDGYRWSSRWEIREDRIAIDGLVNYVSEQSNISITPVEYFTDEDTK